MFTGSLPALGVLLALLSAAILALGNLGQSRGVRLAAEEKGGGSPVMKLLRVRTWRGGTVLIGLAIILQMGSLALAPLILVQPLGVAALVFTVIFTTRISKKKLSPEIKNAIIIILGGVILYVVVASMVGKQKPIGDGQLIAILSVLTAMLLVSLALWIAGKKSSPRPIMYVLLGGIYSGFIATLGKTVILRVEDLLRGHNVGSASENWLTVVCIVGISIASALSIYYVQYSHTCNSPDVVIAGLTIVDPAVAVLLGITILQEAAGAPIWSIFILVFAGAIAFYGVLKLARAETAEGLDT